MAITTTESISTTVVEIGEQRAEKRVSSSSHNVLVELSLDGIRLRVQTLPNNEAANMTIDALWAIFLADVEEGVATATRCKHCGLLDMHRQPDECGPCHEAVEAGMLQQDASVYLTVRSGDTTVTAEEELRETLRDELRAMLNEVSVSLSLR